MVFIPPKMINPLKDYPKNLPYGKIKKIFMELLGDFKIPSVPLDIKILNKTELDAGVVCQKIEYNVEKDERVSAFHLFSINTNKNAPGLLSIHAHGADNIFPFGKSYHCKANKDDPNQYSYRAALEGFRVLAPDALCFGERRNAFGYAKNFMDELNTHAELCGLGKSLTWKSVWDNSRAIEALETLGAPTVGVIGHSGGSTQTYILAAANEKIKAAVCFQSFMTLRHQFRQYRCCHCLYHFIPGMIKKGIDWDQVVSLVPPRKIFMGRGRMDKGTPEPMYRAFVAAIENRCIEEHLPKSLFTHEGNGGHEITKNMLLDAMKFLHKMLD